MDQSLQDTVSAVRAYWDSHPLGFQYLSQPGLEPGTPEFFGHIRPWMNPYKFPWIMERIERESALLHDYIAVANYFESIADIVETNLVHLAESAARHRVTMSDETRQLLRALYDRVYWSIEAAAQAVDGQLVTLAEDVIEAKRDVTRLADRAEAHLASRLTVADPNRLDIFRVESSLIESLKRIYYFAKRIAKAVAESETEPRGERVGQDAA